MESTRTRARIGFTLVELLVVIAIIGVLVALLLPAVQAARESARRTQCKNNLKQVGLAGQNHLNLYKFFPTGGWGYHWIGDPDRGFTNRQPGGWAYNILPFIEEKQIREIGKGLGGAQRDAAMKLLARTPAPFFSCPSRRGGTVGQNADDLYNAPGLDDAANAAARADYAGNGGTDQRTNGGPSLADGMSPAFNPVTTFASWNTATGLTFAGSMVTIKQTPDGLGKTLFVGEKSLQPHCYDGKGTGDCPADNGTIWEGHDWDNIRWGSKGNEVPTGATAKVQSIDWRPLRDENHLQDSSSDWGNGAQWGQTNFGSLHPNGAFFAMGDGSVQTVGYNVDARVMYRLSNRRDGQHVELE